jgi:hypothetical protein
MPGQHEEAERQHDVVQGADDGPDRQLALEAEPEIGEYGEDRQDDADRARLDEFARDAGADGFDAREVVISGEGLARLRHHDALRGLAARLDRKAERHAPLVAEFLDFDLAEAEGVRSRADGARIGDVVLGLELDQRAALEVDAEIEPDRQEHDDGSKGQHGRERERDVPEPHEVEAEAFRPDAKEAHGEAL